MTNQPDLTKTRKLYEAGQIDEALELYKSDPDAVQPNIARAAFIEAMERLLVIRSQTLASEAAHRAYEGR